MIIQSNINLEVRNLEKIYTVEEVAQIINIHPHTVRIWLKSGKLKGIKAGSVWRIKESQLQNFLKENEVN